jgi:20S proteasome subunit alpha 3
MQVEYAVEAINKSRPGVGVLTKEGIVLAAEKDVVSALLEQSRRLFPSRRSPDLSTIA